jgi:hypothetical protein
MFYRVFLYLIFFMRVDGRNVEKLSEVMVFLWKHLYMGGIRLYVHIGLLFNLFLRFSFLPTAFMKVLLFH